MLYPNGLRAFASAGRHMAGSLVACGAMQYGGLGGARFNRNVSGTYSKVLGAVPSGYGGRAYTLAVKAGGLAGFAGVSITPTATGGLGLPGSGSADITFTVADATGQLISSGSGAASLTFTVADALLVASLGGAGSAALTLSTNTPLLGAIASMTADGSFSITASNSQVLPLDTTSPLRTGTASFAITGTLQPYAVGSMQGSTVDTSILTVDAITASIWQAVSSQYTEPGSMGAKLNTASSGGVDLSALAQAVWAHATRSLTGPQASQLGELWAIQGLDKSAPMTVTKTSRQSGDISLDITGDGINSSTVSRQ